jgi:hypothetical protein
MEHLQMEHLRFPTFLAQRCTSASDLRFDFHNKTFFDMPWRFVNGHKGNPHPLFGKLFEFMGHDVISMQTRFVIKYVILLDHIDGADSLTNKPRRVLCPRFN